MCEDRRTAGGRRSRHRYDSKDPHGPTPALDTTAWAAFVAGVKAGDFTA
ncbi:DUF397 domain-containing protein [Streptomyces sp. AC563]|nr:DUF397 domain-containing protein [Streptomyces buecherae]MBC3991081.1 DUF397 domain-containing protein [Streptomyces buecherae]